KHRVEGVRVCTRSRAGDAPYRRVAVERLELAALHEPLERLVQPREPALDQLVVGLDEEDLEPGLRRHLHDAGAHETAPDDTDVGDGHAARWSATSGSGPEEAAARSAPSPAGMDF